MLKFSLSSISLMLLNKPKNFLIVFSMDIKNTTVDLSFIISSFLRRKFSFLGVVIVLLNQFLIVGSQTRNVSIVGRILVSLVLGNKHFNLNLVLGLEGDSFLELLLELGAVSPLHGFNQIKMQLLLCAKLLVESIQG